MVDYLHLTPGEAQVLRDAEAYHAEELAEANERAERAEELAFAYDQTRSPMNPTHKRLLEELERLRAIVAKLPRTADGVPVVPGRDTVWNWLPRGLHSKCSWVECAVEIRQPYNEAMYDYVDISEVGKCYSTREAAEAANPPNCESQRQKGPLS